MQRKVLDGRAEMSVEDLRKVFDHLTTCQAAIVRTGNAAINEKTLIAFFDGQLPMAYNIARQHARRSAHSTLLAHYTDIQSQVRAELNSRQPLANAFSANPNGTAGGGGNGGGNNGGGGGGGAGGGASRGERSELERAVLGSATAVPQQ